MVEQRLFSHYTNNACEEQDDGDGRDAMDVRKQTPASRGLLIGGSRDALYERMFRQQPRMFMTRAQFLTCMRTVRIPLAATSRGFSHMMLSVKSRQVFGLNIAATDAASDTEWLKAVNV